MAPIISVIICTHNPRPDYLRRTLDALKAQTLPVDQWEFLLVDNASKEPLTGKWDLSWHPQSRHIQENELGLTPARLRAIKESTGELLVFVDDDNVLATDYLQQALQISHKFPFIGVWGARIDPEFEFQPPDWTRRFWTYLALRPVERSFWANIVTDYSILPCGAGLCVRRDIAEAYAQKLTSNGHGKDLGRKGQSLTSGEDTEMALTACDLGHGYGLFTELRLLHLIPGGRLSEDYLLRLEEGIAFSSTLLQARRNGALPPAPSNPLRRQLGVVRRRLTMKRMDRLVLEARMRGWHRAYAVISQSPTPPAGSS